MALYKFRIIIIIILVTKDPTTPEVCRYTTLWNK